MGAARSDLGFGADLESFDPADWQSGPPGSGKPRAVEAGRAAEAAGFHSREASPSSRPARQQRRRRTGRNAQFNLKVRPETIDAFCALADRQGWGLGETLEHAVALLEKAYPEH